ncbi:MAG: SGNH/GDSL hydrolase family protein [Solobacterium sp.]|nr:SGNH/GDSL hydrolase family protein [Solobacterium sp.]MBQ9824688.1 SGNH/GDSL hydrolase family protein [Solobacterium sp.]
MKKSVSLLVIAGLIAGCSSPPQTQTDENGEVSNETAAETENSAYACRTFDYYSYDKPVPASEEIGDEFFEDTVIAGDSRVGSLALYSDLAKRGAEIYYTTSITLWRIYDVAPDEGSDSPMFDVLLDTDRHNIYILLGINEIRNENFDAWADEFSAVIDELLEKAPDHKIYLILNYQPRKLENIDAESLKVHVEEQNKRLAEIAKEKHIYYIDISDEMADETGLVKEELVWDGLHFNTEGSKAFADYLARHAVREDNYVKEICE